jgi:hypothetical protein
MGKSTSATALLRRQRIEELSAEGMPIADIAGIVGVSTQHVGRVLDQGKETRTVKPLAGMTVKEFRAALKALGYSETQMAAALGMKPVSIRLFALGERPIRPVVAAAVRMLLEQAGKRRAYRAKDMPGGLGEALDQTIVDTKATSGTGGRQRRGRARQASKDAS